MCSVESSGSTRIAAVGSGAAALRGFGDIVRVDQGTDHQELGWHEKFERGIAVKCKHELLSLLHAAAGPPKKHQRTDADVIRARALANRMPSIKHRRSPSSPPSSPPHPPLSRLAYMKTSLPVKHLGRNNGMCLHPGSAFSRATDSSKLSDNGAPWVCPNLRKRAMLSSTKLKTMSRRQQPKSHCPNPDPPVLSGIPQVCRPSALLIRWRVWPAVSLQLYRHRHRCMRLCRECRRPLVSRRCRPVR